MPKQILKKIKEKTVPYVRGFTAPTELRKKRALGSKPGNTFLPCDCFLPLYKCTSQDDWLAQYKETGQTYRKFLEECPWLSRSRRQIEYYTKQTYNPKGNSLQESFPNGAIYVLPLGEFSGDNSPQFEVLLEYAKIFLHLPIRQMPGITLTVEKSDVYWVYEEKVNDKKQQCKIKLETRMNKKTGRFQLKVGSCHKQLKRWLPDDALCLVALTMSDLFDDTSDLFVAGMAVGSWRVAVFSLLRYDPNLTFSQAYWYHYHEDSVYDKEERQKLILQRSCRLLVHELMHLLGIGHCIFYACCMNGSGHLEEDFKQPMYLCPVDLRKLHTLCNFDVCERYKTLYNFFIKHNMKDEANWYKKRLNCLYRKLDAKQEARELSR